MSVFSCLIKPVAYLGIPVVALHTLSKLSGTVRFYVRLSLFASTVGIMSMWGIVTCAAMSLIGQGSMINYIVARSFYHVASRVMNIKIEVEDEQNISTKPALYVCNHQSLVDILVLGRSVAANVTLRG